MAQLCRDDVHREQVVGRGIGSGPNLGAQRFVNADVLASELGLGATDAVAMANALGRALVLRRERFVFETVFSDPVGDKVTFLAETAPLGYTVVLCFIGLKNAAMSEERVAMRVTQGGHDVPGAISVGCRCPPDDVVNNRAALFQLDVEEYSPMADAAAPRDGLRREAHDVAAERILLHRVEHREHAAPVRVRNPLERSSCGPGEE